MQQQTTTADFRNLVTDQLGSVANRNVERRAN